MRNLKKILSLVVVLAMAISMMTTASASIFSDVSDTDSYAEAVSILNNLKIIQGYEENGEFVFKPSNTVTRAEIAAIMVRTLGLGDPAQTSTVFADVDATHWASGYIETARVHNIVHGFTDNTFRPDDPVTYEQAVKLIVAALGYSPKADSNLYGGYPTGYLRIASEEGISKGIPGTEAVTGTAAKRSTIARLIFNSLEVNMMQQTVFGTGVASYEKTDNTILKTHLKVKKVQGIVSSTYLTEEYDARNRRITIDCDTIDGEIDNSQLTPDEGNTNAVDYLGYSVTAYVAEDDAGNEYLAAIAPRTGRNVVTTIQYSDLSSSRNIASEYRIYYWPANSSRNTPANVEIDANLKVYVNGKEDNSEVYDGYYFNLEDREEEGGFVKLLDNNNDGIYDYAFITAYTIDNTIEFVIDDIDAEEYIISGGNETFEYDPEDEDVLVTFIKDGKPATFEDLEEDDVVTIVGDSNTGIEDAQVITVYASSKKVEGKVTAADRNAGEYTIGGGKYKLSTISNISENDVSVGSEGVFYINYNNRIVKADASATIGGTYGYLLEISLPNEDDFDNVYKVRFIDENGKTQTKELATRFTFYEGFNTRGTTVDLKKNNLPEELFHGRAVQGVIRYNLDNSGKVNRIALFSDADAVIEYTPERNASYDAEDNSYGVFEFGKNTVAFAIDSQEVTGAGRYTADAITVTTPAELLADGEKYNLLVFENDKEDVVFVIVVDPEVAIDKSQNAFIITKISNVLVDDEEAFKLEGLQGGKTVSYTISEEVQDVTYYDLNNVEIDYELGIGDAIIVSTGKGNFVKNVQVIASAEEVEFGDAPTVLALEDLEDEDLVTYAGEIVKVSGTTFFFDEDNDEGYVKGSSGTSYTLVDFTTARDVTVSRTTSSTVRANTQYENYAVVRYYEGRAIDVIYYRIERVR